MPCTKRFTTFRIRLLDGHVSIAKPDNLFLAFRTSFYNKLLTTRNLAFRLVAFHLRLVDLSHHANPYATSSSNAATIALAVAAAAPTGSYPIA